MVAVGLYVDLVQYADHLSTNITLRVLNDCLGIFESLLRRLAMGHLCWRNVILSGQHSKTNRDGEGEVPCGNLMLCASHAMMFAISFWIFV